MRLPLLIISAIKPVIKCQIQMLVSSPDLPKIQQFKISIVQKSVTETCCVCNHSQIELHTMSPIPGSVRATPLESSSDIALGELCIAERFCSLASTEEAVFETVLEAPCRALLAEATASGDLFCESFLLGPSGAEAKSCRLLSGEGGNLLIFLDSSASSLELRALSLLASSLGFRLETYTTNIKLHKLHQVKKLKQPKSHISFESVLKEPLKKKGIDTRI